MSFLLPCPNCGARSAYEFEFGGEYRPRPPVEADWREWTRYLYLRTNSPAEQTEWWYHRMGCRLWFLAVRNTSTNQVRSTFWPEQIEERHRAGEKWWRVTVGATVRKVKLSNTTRKGEA